MLRLYFCAVLVCTVGSALALECPTCLGDACDGAIPLVACNKGLTPELPFKLKTHMKTGDTPDYACLSLEYFDNGELQQIQKCHLTPKSGNVFTDIESSLGEYSPVVKCTIGVLEEKAFDFRAEGSGDDDNGAGSSDDDDAGKNDDSGAGSIHLSIFTLLSSVFLAGFLSS